MKTTKVDHKMIYCPKMCGRAKQSGKRKDFENSIVEFKPDGDINLPNIKPTQPVQIVIKENGELKTVSARWWAQYPNGVGWNTKYKTFNAKVSKLHTSRLWSILYKRSQFCLMPITSFYEWDVKGEPPMEIFLPNQKHFALAGLWSRYFEIEKDEDQNETEVAKYSFTVFTTQPNDFMKPIHPTAMPIILDSLESQSKWVKEGDEDTLVPYLRDMEAVKLEKPL